MDRHVAAIALSAPSGMVPRSDNLGSGAGPEGATIPGFPGSVACVSLASPGWGPL